MKEIIPTMINKTWKSQNLSFFKVNVELTDTDSLIYKILNIIRSDVFTANRFKLYRYNVLVLS